MKVLAHGNAQETADEYVRLYLQGRHRAAPDRVVIEQRTTDILARPRWVLALLPIRLLNYQMIEDSGDERIARARRYAALSTPLPPGVAYYNARSQSKRVGRAFVVDGNHRVLGAHLRGDRDVRMFMPEDDYWALVRDAAP